MMKNLLPAIVLAFCAPAAAMAQDAPLPIVGLYADVPDSAGAELLAKFRDAVQKAGYFPSTNAAEPLVGVHLITLDPEADHAGRQTIYSAAWTTPDGRLVTHRVGICALNRAAQCAATLMETTSMVARLKPSLRAIPK